VAPPPTNNRTVKRASSGRFEPGTAPGPGRPKKFAATSIDTLIARVRDFPLQSTKEQQLWVKLLIDRLRPAIADEVRAQLRATSPRQQAARARRRRRQKSHRGKMLPGKPPHLQE